MDQRSSRTLWLVGVGLATFVAFAIGIWRSEPPAPQRVEPTAASPPASPPAKIAETPAETAEPGHRISEFGRLTLEAGDLPVFGPVALVLDLPDEARGDSEPRTVRIVCEDGRALDTTASIEPGAGNGVRIEIDSSWLRRGDYMISVTTSEPTHFPVRRYVLEIR
jgi:hypothetical protein